MNRIAILCFLCAVSAAFGKTADYIILSHPDDYTILNQYQQPISTSEKALFVSFCPLRMQNDHEILGDQITRAMRVEFAGNTWFLQENDAGILLGDRGRQYRPVYKQCDVLNDTVRVDADRAVPFSEKFPPARQGEYLEKGEIVVRLFSYGAYCCVMRNGARVRYGWCSFSRKASWKRVETTTEEPQGLTGFISDRIVSRFAAANKTYKEYFEHFNALTHQDKSIPVWHCTVKGSEMRCSLHAPSDLSEQLDASTQYLVRDIENLLIGKHYSVILDKEDIIVRPGPENGGGQ